MLGSSVARFAASPAEEHAAFLEARRFVLRAHEVSRAADLAVNDDVECTFLASLPPGRSLGGFTRLDSATREKNTFRRPNEGNRTRSVGHDDERAWPHGVRAAGHRLAKSPEVAHLANVGIVKRAVHHQRVDVAQIAMPEPARRASHDREP